MRMIFKKRFPIRLSIFLLACLPVLVKSQDTATTIITDPIPVDSNQTDSVPVKIKSHLGAVPDTIVYLKQSKIYVPDTVYLLTGDRITGRILSFEYGRLSFDAQASGVVSIKWNKIRTIKGGSRIFKVEDIRGEIYIGNIDASKDTGEILIQSTLKYGLMFEDIARVFPIETDWYRGFKGNLGGGVSYTKSSDVLRVNAEYNIYYIVTKWRFVNSLSYIETVTNHEERSINSNIDFQALYALVNKWVLYEINSYTRNDELGIRARLSIGAGGGNSIVQTEQQRLLVLTGLVGNSEKDIESNTPSTNFEWPLSLQHSIFSFITPNLSSTFSATSYVGITDKNRFRLDTSVDFTWEFVNNFDLSLSMYYNFDNKTLVGKDTKEDYGTVLSLLLDLK